MKAETMSGGRSITSAGTRSPSFAPRPAGVSQITRVFGPSLGVERRSFGKTTSPSRGINFSKLPRYEAVKASSLDRTIRAKSFKGFDTVFKATQKPNNPNTSLAFKNMERHNATPPNVDKKLNTFLSSDYSTLWKAKPKNSFGARPEIKKDYTPPKVETFAFHKVSKAQDLDKRISNETLSNYVPVWKTKTVNQNPKIETQTINTKNTKEVKEKRKIDSGFSAKKGLEMQTKKAVEKSLLRFKTKVPRLIEKTNGVFEKIDEINTHSVKPEVHQTPKTLTKVEERIGQIGLELIKIFEENKQKSLRLSTLVQYKNSASTNVESKTKFTTSTKVETKEDLKNVTLKEMTIKGKNKLFTLLKKMFFERDEVTNKQRKQTALDAAIKIFEKRKVEKVSGHEIVSNMPSNPQPSQIKSQDIKESMLPDGSYEKLITNLARYRQIHRKNLLLVVNREINRATAVKTTEQITTKEATKNEINTVYNSMISEIK